MTTSEYGRFTNYNAWIAVLNIFVGLQTQGSIANARIFTVDSRLIPIMIVHSFFSFTVSFYSEKLIQEKAVEKNGVISFFIAMVTAGLSVMLVRCMTSERYIGRIYGAVIPMVIVGIIEIILIYKKGKLLTRHGHHFIMSLEKKIIIKRL